MSVPPAESTSVRTIRRAASCRPHRQLAHGFVTDNNSTISTNITGAATSNTDRSSSRHTEMRNKTAIVAYCSTNAAARACRRRTHR